MTNRDFHTIKTDIVTSTGLLRAADAFSRVSQNDTAEAARRGRSKLSPQQTERFLLTSDWCRHKNGVEMKAGSYRANARRIARSEEEYVERDSERDPLYEIYNNDLNGNKPKAAIGDQIWATKRGNRWELFELESSEVVRAKELFPAVVFKRTAKGKDDDGNEIDVPETWIVCPGGNTETGPTNIVHAFHVEKRAWSTSEFGKLPFSMANFGAAIVHVTRISTGPNGNVVAKDVPILTCASGLSSESIKNIAQFYEFEIGEWFTAEQATNYAGCPVIAIVNSEKALIIGGRNAFYVSSPAKQAVSGLYAHYITPLWELDPATGATSQKYPLRTALSGYTETPESAIANREKAFLKTNFSGAWIEQNPNLIFMAFGGLEQGSSYPKSVISYSPDSFIDTPEYTQRPKELKTCPDTPVVFGECATVGVNQLGHANQLTEWRAIICLGGRERTSNGIVLHKKAYMLDWDVMQWRDDILPELPTRRYNAPCVAIPMEERERDENGNEIDDGRVFQTIKIFCPGGRGIEMTGRDKDGNPIWEKTEHLLSSMDVLDLRTMKWERDWPGFDNKIRKVTKNGETTN